MSVIKSADLETGDLTQFDNISDNFATFDAAGAAAKTGSYGMRIVDGYGYGQFATGSGTTDLYYGFHLYIDPDITLAAFNQINIIQLFMDTFSGGDSVFLGIIRGSGDGPPVGWVFQTRDGVHLNRVTTNFSVGDWHWIQIRVRVGSDTESGAELVIDGDTLYSSFTSDWSAISYIMNSRFGAPTVSQPLGTDEYLYFDNIILDDAEYPDEPVDGGGTNYDVSVSDGIYFSDSRSGALGINASVFDGLSLDDSDSGSVGMSGDVSDSAIFFDTITTGGLIVVSVSDGITLSDSVTAAKTIFSSVSDGFNLSDSVGGNAQFSVTVVDGTVLSDVISTSMHMLAAVDDSIRLSDIVFDSTFLPTGEVSLTITAKKATITFTAKAPGVAFTRN